MNNLKNEKSSYLKSAVHQPVNWYPWCMDAFKIAKEKELPVLLDIGAAWCHWCHVMDDESYGDADTAAIINDNFIAIKVDKDERPDIDARYQKAVSLFSGSGGWPLTAFLTYDGYFFYGGTYFPKESAFGLPAYKSVLIEIAKYYGENKEAVFEQSINFYEKLFKSSGGIVSPVGFNIKAIGRIVKGNDSLNEKQVSSLVKSASDEFKLHFDKESGGLEEIPKFYYFSALELLLWDYLVNKDRQSLSMGIFTLKNIAFGGVFDHIAGGFHRYSTDKNWIIPHFEKLAADNAFALRIYSLYYKVSGDEVLLHAINKTLDFISGEIYDKVNGGFYASMDADIGDGDDGDYFTWSLKDFRDIFAKKEELISAAKIFNIGKEGVMHFNDSAQNSTKDERYEKIKNNIETVKNVLYLDYRNYKDSRNDTNLNENIVSSETYAEIVRKLKIKREKRKRPFIDMVKYSSVNGAVIYSLISVLDILNPVDKYLERRRIIGMAEKSIAHFISAFDKKGDVGRFTLESGGSILEDNAYIVLALIGLFEATFKQIYLIYAKKIAEYAIKNFFDGENGAFFDIMHSTNSSKVGYLMHKEKSILDYGGYSPQSMIILAMSKLYRLSAEVQFKNVVERSIGFFINEIEANKHNSAGFLSSLINFTAKADKNIIVGRLVDSEIIKYLEKIYYQLKGNLNTINIFIDINNSTVISDYIDENAAKKGFDILIFEEIKSAVNEYLKSKKPLIYKCGDKSCDIKFL